MRVRLATFNIENLGRRGGDALSIEARRPTLQAQLARLDADILCLQEINAQEAKPGPARQLTDLNADGLGIVVARGRVMAEVARAGEPGGMLAVGSDRDAAESLAGEHGLTLANENSPQQFVLSGPLARIEEAEAAAKGSGVRAKKLAVAGAFHTEAMSPGVDAFRAELDEIEFRSPETPVVSSTSADFFRDDVRDSLAASLVSPIRWTAVLAKLSDLGVTRYLDVGPGKVLAGLVRRTLADPEVEIVSNRESALA